MSGGDLNSLTDQLAQASVGKDLNTVTFCRHRLKLNTAEDAKAIIDALKRDNKVLTFCLEGNTLGVEAAKVIGKALEEHPELERALWSDMFTGRLKTEIPEALRYLGNGIQQAGAGLVELDLSDNAFGPNGMTGLVDLLKSASCYSLQVLRLHNNGLGTTGGKMLAECLVECYKESAAKGKPLALRVFQSGRGRLENEGAKALSVAFKAMGSLEEVVMPQNGIYHEGIAALADAFTACKNLRHINLQDNTFTEIGAQSMAKALVHMQKLETINFADCILRTGGATILAKALESGHTELKILNMSFNEIKTDGANAVAEAMENKENLETLDLNGNCLGESGIELVSGTLEAIGMAEMLGSLSDDEGSDEDEGKDDEEEPADDSEGDEVADPGLAVVGVAVTPRTNKPVSAADFLRFPSPTKLVQLGARAGDAVLEHLGPSMDVEEAVQSIMRTASVVSLNDPASKEVACACADKVLSKAFSTSDDSVSAITNTIMVNLGLLKSEDKTFKPLSDITGALLVLAHIVKQKYFPRMAKDILSCFISRPHPKLETCTEAKHVLLQALFQ